MKKYLICHFWWKTTPNGKISGFGNIDIETEPGEEIYTPSGIQNVIDYITNKNEFDGCVILNIIPLHG